MALTLNQRKIVDYARQNDNKITKKEACALIPFYHNTDKHVGVILSRMVKSGMIIRLKPGHFKLSNGQKTAKAQLTIENQLNLL
ncbi:hypothetical protein [Sphingobacterium detergens]|uniref:hypothetical protein n=1 Tax=Sphingobacterium detergens TaxID=1145106 RepID=UPI003AAFFD81